MVIGLILAGTRAFAQSVSIPDAEVFLSPQPAAMVNPFEQPNREYNGLPVGGWMLYPTLFSGVAFNDNVFQTGTNRTADFAWRTSPSLTAVLNTGINKLTLYGSADAYVYEREHDANTINGRVGLLDVWEAQRDLIFRFSGDASRQTDLTNGGQIIAGTVFSPIHYEQYESTASVMKGFDRFFVGAGGTFLNTTFENPATVSGIFPSQAYRDYNAATLSGRAGYWVGPTIYSYAEATGNTQDYYNSSLYDSNGYRVVGGLGADHLSLFKGEIYAGYQEQFYHPTLSNDIGGGVFGGKVYWYPTQFLTFSAKVDESLGTATYVSPTDPIGSSTKVTSADLKADYAMSTVWSATAHLDYANTLYVGASRIDNAWAVGATLNYKIWGNFLATLDYQLARLDSNSPGASFTQNIVSLGLTYKY